MELTVVDIGNLVKLLGRVQYNGLEEARAAVLLEQKLIALGKELTEGKDGDVPTTD